MFQRLIKSSRFQASVAGMLACVIVAAAGWDDGKTDDLTGLLIKVIAGLTAVFAGGTAFEDVAKKLMGAESAGSGDRDSGTENKGATPPVKPVSIERGAFRSGQSLTLLVLFLLPLVVLGIGGCSTFDPGGQTAKAVAQRSQFLWSAENAFQTDIDGAQTGSFTMYQGAGPPKLKEDGSVDWENSETSYYLKYDPKADAAREAFTIAYQQSTMQMQMQLQTLNALIGMIGARMGVGVGGDGSFVPPVAQPATEDKWSARLDRLEKLFSTAVGTAVGGKPAGSTKQGGGK